MAFTAAQYRSLSSLPVDRREIRGLAPVHPGDRVWYHRRPTRAYPAVGPIPAEVLHVWDARAGLINLKVWEERDGTRVLCVEIDVTEMDPDRPPELRDSRGWSWDRGGGRTVPTEPDFDDDPGVYATGAPLPPHLRRDLPPPRRLRGDPASARIARLLRLHPELEAEFPGLDLMATGRGERAAILRRIRGRLGIPDTEEATRGD